MTRSRTFGEVVRELREERGLPLRKIAAQLDIDSSTLGKIERSERFLKKELVEQLARVFSIDPRHLLVSYLSDKVAYTLLEEENANDILRTAQEKIKYLKKAKNYDSRSKKKGK